MKGAKNKNVYLKITRGKWEERDLRKRQGDVAEGEDKA